MYIFKTDNDVFFANESLDFIKKFISDIEYFRESMKKFSRDCNDLCESLLDSDNNYKSLCSEFYKYAKTVTTDFSIGDVLIKKMDSRHSELFSQVCEKWFSDNGRPDWIDSNCDIFNNLIDHRQTIYYEILEIQMMTNDLSSSGYTIPKCNVISRGDM